MDFEEHLDNNNYTPVPATYYNYKGKSRLTLYNKKELFEYNDINICAYMVNNEKKYPFQQFLLKKSIMDFGLTFPMLQIFNNLKKNELVEYTKVCLFGLLGLDNYELFNYSIQFDGFYEYNNSLYLFFDLTKNNLQFCPTYSNSLLWLALIDEIVNHKNICNIQINEIITQLFRENQDLCFLIDENNENYDLPIISYNAHPEKQLNYTYIFGQLKDTKYKILGPHYYFKDYYNAYEEAGSLIKDNSKMGIVRFAIFIGNVKYIENYPNDPVDESEIKKQRLQDQNLDQNIERLTMRITDHDGKWADNYDSVYLGNLELDDGNLLNKQLVVVKEYEQQMPLSYHLINKIPLKAKKEDYLIM